MNNPFHLNDKVQVITCPPHLGDWSGAVGFITQIHDVLPEHNLPRATVFLGCEQSITINAVFLRLLKRYEVEVAPRSLQIQTPMLVAGASLLTNAPPRLTRGEAIRAGQQRRADELGISLEEFHKRGPAKRRENQVATQFVPIEVPPEVSAPLPAKGAVAPTCQRCGRASPLLAGINRCDGIDAGGRRCGGVLRRG